MGPNSVWQIHNGMDNTAILLPQGNQLKRTTKRSALSEENNHANMGTYSHKMESMECCNTSTRKADKTTTLKGNMLHRIAH
eukprot:2034291-Ditylum_brightwellii.AAC.1